VVVAQTARVLIRELENSDTPALSKILGDPSVMEFSSKGALTEADTVRFIEWCSGSYQENGYGQWALIEKKSGALMGFCGLSHATVDGIDEVEIAYRLAHDQWGKGLASEAAHIVLEHGFSICNIESIVGIVSPHHGASIRVLEKIGFQSFSQTRYNGLDVRVYRLAKYAWKSYKGKGARLNTCNDSLAKSPNMVQHRTKTARKAPRKLKGPCQRCLGKIFERHKRDEDWVSSLEVNKAAESIWISS